MSERISVTRVIPVDRRAIFAVLTDPQGHVAIDSRGMLPSADGERVSAPGDSFIVRMDRESLGDRPMEQVRRRGVHHPGHRGFPGRVDGPRDHQTADRTRLRLHAGARP